VAVEFDSPPALPVGGFQRAVGRFRDGTIRRRRVPIAGDGGLEFDGHGWKEIYRSQSTTVREWAGEKGAVWVQDGNRVIELAAGQQHTAEKAEALSGVLLSVNPEHSGKFWVGSSQGLALHTTPLWETPPGAPHLDDVVNAIAEDRSEICVSFRAKPDSL